MQKIGFPQYTPRLLEYGWDNLDFLNEMTETDLDEARIPRDHRRMVGVNYFITAEIDTQIVFF